MQFAAVLLGEGVTLCASTARREAILPATAKNRAPPSSVTLGSFSPSIDRATPCIWTRVAPGSRTCARTLVIGTAGTAIPRGRALRRAVETMVAVTTPGGTMGETRRAGARPRVARRRRGRITGETRMATRPRRRRPTVTTGMSRAARRRPIVEVVATITRPRPTTRAIATHAPIRPARRAEEETTAARASTATAAGARTTAAALARPRTAAARRRAIMGALVPLVVVEAAAATATTAIRPPTPGTRVGRPPTRPRPARRPPAAAP